VKNWLLISTFIFSCGYLLAQEQKQHADSLVNAKKEKLQSKADSLKEKFKPDSATAAKIHRADSTLKGVKSKLNAIQSANLNTLLIKPPDSVTQKTNGKISKVKSTSDSLQQKLNEPVNSVQKKINEKTSFMDSLNMSVKDPITGKSANYGMEGVNTNVKDQLGKDMKLPDNNLSLPNASKELNLNNDLKMPDTKGLTEAEGKLKDLQSLPKEQLNQTGALDEVNELKGKAKEVGQVTKKADVYKNDVKNINEGGLEKAEALPKEAEKLATNVDEVKGIQSEAQKMEAGKNVLQQYQDMVQQLNKEALESKAESVGEKEFADHFSGNEQKLQVGVANLNKLKRKYGNIPDSRYLPKRVPNQLKGKPLIERLVPGINMQVFQQRNLVNIDVSPFMAYRIYPRWRVAAGGTYRFQFNKKVHLKQENPAYGYRLFTNYNAFAGFHLHAEMEWMRTITYNPYSQAFDPSYSKHWVPGLFGGVWKQYKVSKKINGNFQVLYNFLYERNGLYPNKLVMRFGFEFPIKKKVKLPKDEIH
jgi:hypothetical protein